MWELKPDSSGTSPRMTTDAQTAFSTNISMQLNPIAMVGHSRTVFRKR